ncbi:MAG: hypothetical protein ACRC42_03320 [Mycoplasma sp.]
MNDNFRKEVEMIVQDKFLGLFEMIETLSDSTKNSHNSLLGLIMSLIESVNQHNNYLIKNERVLKEITKSKNTSENRYLN